MDVSGNMPAFPINLEPNEYKQTFRMTVLNLNVICPGAEIKFLSGAKPIDTCPVRPAFKKKCF